MRETAPTNVLPRPSQLRRRLFDLIGLLLVCTWLAVLALRFERDDHEAVESGLQSSGEAGLRPGDEWHGLYMADSKVGHLHLRKRRQADPPGWEISSDLRLKLLVLGISQQLRVTLRARLDAALLLRSFQAEMTGGNAGEFQVEGVVAGQQVEVTFHSAGERQTKLIQLQRPPTLDFATRPLLAHQGLAVGKQFSLEFFDPLSQAVRRLEVRVVGEDDLFILGGPVRCFILEQRLDGLELKAWVTAAGEVVREELPLGLLAIRETEEEARYGAAVMGTGAPRTPVDPRLFRDIADMNSVAAVGELDLLREPWVRLQLRGGWTSPAGELPGQRAPDGGLPPDGGLAERDPLGQWAELAAHLELDGGRQLLQGDELRIRLEAPARDEPYPRAVQPGLPPEADRAAEPLIQADHPEIIETARQVVGDATTSWQAVQRLVRWVHEEVTKTGVVGVPSALEVLRTRRGDCNEHTSLFVALARAASIPARQVAGLVYLPEQQRFFYHAWADVQIGDLRVEVDPTFGEAPASAARIRLVRGGLDRQVELFRVIGQLEQIRVLPWLAPDPVPRTASSPATQEVTP